MGSNYPASANAPFNVLWTTNLAAGASDWRSNLNVLGPAAFDGTDGRFTNVIVREASRPQMFFWIQVP